MKILIFEKFFYTVLQKRNQNFKNVLTCLSSAMQSFVFEKKNHSQFYEILFLYWMI